MVLKTSLMRQTAKYAINLQAKLEVRHTQFAFQIGEAQDKSSNYSYIKQSHKR